MYKDCPLCYTKPVSITIKYNNNTINQIIESDIREFFLPKSLWKDDAFKKEFQKQILNNLNNINFDELDEESNLKTMCKNLDRNATSGYKTCFPQRSAHTSFPKVW